MNNLTKLKYKASDVCQLMDKSKYPATKTSNGITFTNNDGVIIVNGTAKPTASYSITDVGIAVIGHKYLLAGGVNYSCYIDGYISYSVSDVHFGNDIGSGYIFTANVSGMMRVLLRVAEGYTATNVTFKPQLFDLTEMYGAGNEPTTLAEFRQSFPNDLYLYSPLCYLSIAKLKYKASDVCQLMDKSKYPATKTSNGITFTNNDGVIIVNGTAKPTASYSITDVGIAVIGHKYLLAGGVNYSCYIDGYISYSVSDVHFGNDIGSGYIFTANVSGMMRVLLRVVTNYAATNVMFKPQLFDLTEMYGAGNEPTTLAEFRQSFPNDLYQYSPLCYLSLNKGVKL